MWWTWASYTTLTASFDQIENISGIPQEQQRLAATGRQLIANLALEESTSEKTAQLH